MSDKQVRHYLNKQTGMIEEVEILAHVDYSSMYENHMLIAVSRPVPKDKPISRYSSGKFRQ